MKKALYINAGAGSGKTYRLTHDLADFLTGTNENEHNETKARIKPSQVIVTTFTKAAAAEIKERARRVLLEQGCTEDASLLETASIGTIHSVAQKFINRYWYYIGLSPNQDVMTDEDIKIYRNRSLGKFMDSMEYESESDAVKRYYEEFRPKKYQNNIPATNPDFWTEDVNSVVQKASYYGVNDLSDKSDSYKRSCAEIDRLFDNDTIPDDKKYTEIVKALIAHLQGKDKSTGNDSKIIRKLRMLPNNMTYDSLIKLFSILSLKEFEDYSLEQRLVNGWLRSRYYGNIIKNCVKSVFSIASAWMKDYENFKRKAGVIDYDDMEKGFYSILTDDRCKDVVVNEIQREYKLLMVDEFQDCNPMQLRIFERLSEIIAEDSPLHYSSIFVGDPNQSIYGFRGSDTDLINRATKQFYDVSRTGLDYDELGKSYRSRQTLINHANRIFSVKGFFDRYTPLTSERKDEEGLESSVMHWHAEKGSKDGFVLKIKDVVENKSYKVQDKESKGLRDIQYSDIAILTRTNADVSSIAEQLRKEGITVSASESDIKNRAEVQLLLAMLNLRYKTKDEDGKSVLKERPHELASLLRLWGDKTTEEILQERSDYVKETTENEWLKDYYELNPIRIALDHAASLPLNEKITSLILELDLYDRVKKWGEADVRRQNLMTLQHVAEQYVSRCSRMHIPADEKGFCQYLEETDIKAAKGIMSNGVTVSTYHSAKGLEWPMVILYSLDSKQLKLDDGKQLNSFLRNNYYGVHELQSDEKTIDDTFRKYSIVYFPFLADGLPDDMKTLFIASELFKISENRQKEEMKRLYYVGLTRARDYAVYLSVSEKYDWTTDFCWLDKIECNERNVFSDSIKIEIPALIPKEKKEPKVPTAKNPHQSTINKYNNEKTAYEEYIKALIVEQKRQAEIDKPKSYSLHDIGPLTENNAEKKYLHPSKLNADSTEMKDRYESINIEGATRVPVTTVNKEGNEIYFRPDDFGSCIHNIFAACPYDGKNEMTDIQKEEYIATAEGVVRNYHLENVVTDIGTLLDNLYSLFAWLKTNYGAPDDILHEYPFEYPYGNKDQIIRGEIDLVWQTPETDIIVDFKNYMGDAKYLLERTGDAAQKEHFVGAHYVPQLSAYRNIWQKNHRDKNARTYLYYDILGCIIEV